MNQEAFVRADGLARTDDLLRLKASATRIAQTLVEDGFELDDAIQYLYAILKTMNPIEILTEDDYANALEFINDYWSLVPYIDTESARDFVDMFDAVYEYENVWFPIGK